MLRMRRKFLIAAVLMGAGPLQALPPDNSQLAADWLVDRHSFVAKVQRDEKRVVMENGLVRREFSLQPACATTEYLNLANGQSMIRAVRPEAMLVIDGREWAVGGLKGQPNLAYLSEEWLAAMTPDPSAMRLVSVEEGQIEARREWAQVRHHAPDAVWPPKGKKVSFTYEMPESGFAADAPRRVLWEDRFARMDPSWKLTASKLAERTSFENEGKAGEIYALTNTHCFAERPLPEGVRAVEAVIHPGTDLGTSWGPGLGLVMDKGRCIEVNLRPGDRGEHGHFELRDGGVEKLAVVKALQAPDGGLMVEKATTLRVLIEGDSLRWETRQGEGAWQKLFETGTGGVKPVAIRVGKTDRAGGDGDDAANPGEWGRSRIERVTFLGEAEAANKKSVSPLRVAVHYEIYDGIPLMAKWLTVENRGSKAVTIDRFTAETLALVEHDNHVETRDGIALPKPTQLHVETDMAFGSFNADQANRHAVRILPDPAYTTQVNYELKQPCLLEVGPDRGPAQTLEAGETFESFRVFELAMDSEDRERRGLSVRRMYRTIAPWVTENPLMHHLLNSNPAEVKKAIDQAAEVGFEMVILSFGSGFNAENDSPAYLEQWREVAEYAARKKIDLGCYSLYSSRKIGGGNDIVTPPGLRPIHGNCPAVTSPWGQAYLGKLENLFEKSGFTVFEHDGPYPGDVDVTPRPPLQKGADDSQWLHWKTWSGFYGSLRRRGVYLNTPDYYYLAGANKCGMGYREVNWSLPREQQLIHTRQNIYDATWEKTPSMGWMFVPLSQYQGGGAAATIEPLDEHIDHYERMIISNLACGVQACYRGPRLYDTPRVREMLKERVAWYKAHRDILEGDMVHLRRADGRKLDGVLHVNPGLKTPALLAVFNPSNREIEESWKVPLYYAGLKGETKATIDGREALRLQADEMSRVELKLKVPAGGFQWVTFGPGGE
jgi:hypothetical protein